MRIVTTPCAAQALVPLSSAAVAGMPSHTCMAEHRALPVGTTLHSDAELTFSVVGHAVLPLEGAAHAARCPLLKAHKAIECTEKMYTVQRKGYALAWITLSDSKSTQKEHDASGPTIGKMVREAIPLCHEQGFILPDDAHSLQQLLVELALGHGYDLICTTGGTGLGPRDITPEATLAVIEKRLMGFEQAMLQHGLMHTPKAILSRAVVGTLGTCICINVPGSVRAVTQNLSAILSALPHALGKLHGDLSPCGDG